MNLNIEREELDKFALMAKDWWDVNGPCKPLHIINKPRLKFVTDKINLNDREVLDIGCGGGILSESLYDKGARVTAIDATLDVINTAKHHAHNKSINYIHTTAEECAVENKERFDIITCMELLEHVPDPKSLINAALSMLKPGGLIFLSTINRNLKAYMFAIIGAEYVMNLLPKGTHEYEKFLTPSELSNLLREEGATLQDIKGINYNPLLSTAHLTSNTSVNYIAYATKD